MKRCRRRLHGAAQDGDCVQDRDTLVLNVYWLLIRVARILAGPEAREREKAAAPSSFTARDLVGEQLRKRD
jgi:hypothetical protein